MTHVGNGSGLTQVRWGERAGSENVQLIASNLPSHNHSANAALGLAGANNPNGALLGGGNFYISGTTVGKTFAGTMIGNTGGNQAFYKRSPFLGMYHCIALTGTFPSRN